MTTETSPLLQDSNTDRLERVDVHVDGIKDESLVDFDLKDDPEDPQQWPKIYKWAIVCLLAFNAFTVCVKLS
jgi:hypothetical protein